MRRNYRRPVLAVGLVAAVAVLLAIVVGSSRTPQVSVKSHKLSGDPDKNRTYPGTRGQRGLGPAASQLAIQELQNKAYPSSTLPFSWRKGAMQAFSAAAGRGADGGGSWQLAGPSVGTYPAILNRTNAEYVASGRVTALAVAPACVSGNCRLWVGAAGGGVWRTNDALAATPSWTNVSGSFGTSAIGALTYDSATNTLYAGTGEQNASADSDAGLGIFKSTDGGDHWTLLPGSPAMSQANAVSAIVVSGSTIYVGTTYGVAGMAGVGGGAQPSFVPGSGAPKPGLWKSTDGGNSFNLMFDDSAGAWGVNNVAVDSHGVVYIASIGKGIFRSSDGGTNWEQIFQAATAANRTELALNTVDGHTRIYIGDGGDGTIPTTGVYHADSIDTATAASLITGGTNGGYTRVPVSPSTQSGRLTRTYCDGQCWYDNTVYSPPGSPDVVYVLGSFDYNNQPFGVDNGAAVLLSTDGGVTWSDVTRDSGDNQIHPDQHAIVTSSSNPLLFFEGSDGGVMRSDGTLTDASARCDAVAPLGATAVAICTNANKAVPTHLYNLNAGLSTLQFQNAVNSPANPSDVMGGTQDNGTWEGTAGNANWPQTMYGDGGIAQFDVGDPAFRMNEFFSQYTDVNFQNGAPDKWVIVSAPFFASGEASAFYKPQLADPVTSGTLFVGLQSLWRTQDFGGNQDDLEANCPEFFVGGDTPGCGDFVPLGDPAGKGGIGSASDLTSPSGSYGADKSGGYVVAIARASGDTSTLWTATRRGRVFISKNADGAAGSVSFTRIDAGSALSSKSLPTPRRFVSGIVVDPKDPNHAFVSFGGYNEATDGVTPAVPGHVFDVTYNPKTGQATWTSLDNGNGPLGNLPINALALDSKTDRLYVGTDFGVLVSVGRSGMWRPAAAGLPSVAVSGLTLDSKNRVLYAATHGRSIWMLKLNGG
jgi:hypothetical protein